MRREAPRCRSDGAAGGAPAAAYFAVTMPFQLRRGRRCAAMPPDVIYAAGMPDSCFASARAMLALRELNRAAVRCAS